MAELLDDTLLDAEQRAMVETVRGEAISLLGLLNDLLDSPRSRRDGWSWRRPPSISGLSP
jgi:signal transduction histidine kinase